MRTAPVHNEQCVQRAINGTIVPPLTGKELYSYEMDRKELLRRLARAVLAFQDSYLAREDSPVGLLCQVGG